MALLNWIVKINKPLNFKNVYILNFYVNKRKRFKDETPKINQEVMRGNI